MSHVLNFALLSFIIHCSIIIATHGTGVNTGNMVNYLDSLSLVTPSGEVRCQIHLCKQ